MSEDESKIAVTLSERTAEQHFANMVVVRHTPHNFAIDCIQIAPSGLEGMSGLVVSRIALPPAVAKKLAAALASQVEQYEKKHGTIPPLSLFDSEVKDERNND